MSNTSENTFIHMFTVSTEGSVILNEGGNASSSFPMLAFNKSASETADETIQDKLSTVQYFVCPTLLVFGLLGNMCTILTVSDVQFHHMTSRCILYALAVSDSLSLSTNPFNKQFMLDILKQDARAFSNVGCKLFFVMFRSSKITSSWLVVLIGIERFVAVLFPLKVKRVITKKTVCVSISVIYVMSFTLTGFATFSTKIINGTCRSDVTTPINIGLHKTLVMLFSIFYFIVPMIILVTLTPLIILKLYRSQRRQQDLNHSNVGRSAKDMSRVTRMLIGVVITYIVCLTPIALSLILTVLTNEPIFTSQKIGYAVLSGVAVSFEQLNNSINFFVYIMCCRQFRERFFHMIKCSRIKILGANTTTFGATTERNPETDSSYGIVTRRMTTTQNIIT